MKKRSEKSERIKLTITLIAIFALLCLFVIWMANTEPKEDPGLQAEAEYQASVKRSHLMTDYMELLHIQGDYTIEDDVVIFQSIEQDKGKLIEDVALYNAFYQDEPLTVEELNYEFEIFCQKMISSQTLRIYEDGLKEIKHRLERVDIEIEEYGYHRLVTKQLDNYGTNIYNATDEQWQSASEYAADILYRDVLNREATSK